MRLFESTSQDIRYAVRAMRSSVGLTTIAILSLGLGIGATIAIFSVIYALAIKPLPVSQPDQLVEVEGHLGGNLHNYAEWKVFRDRQDIFSGVLAYNWSDAYFQIADAKGQHDVVGGYVSGDYFSTLGISAVLGRTLQSSDDRPGAPPVCLIGYGLWRRLYGQSRDVLGRSIRVNGNEFAIIGVAPKSFFGVEIGDILEIFMPMEAQRTYKDYPIRYGKQMPSLDEPRALKVSFVARLKPGMNVGKANAGLQVLSSDIYKAVPPISDASGRTVGPARLVARPITSDTWLQSMNMVLLLMAMAAVALIIACANLGNLLLARAAKRRGEMATRLALGASRWRLVRQLLTESALLSVGGAAAGLIISRWGSQILLWALSFPDDPISLDLSWDAELATFAVSITVFCALLFGLSPAIRSTRISIYSAMYNGVTTGKPGNRFSNSLLVVVQVALSVAVLVSAGLLARTLQAFLTADLGYDPKGVVTAQATLHGSGVDPQRNASVGEELLMAFRSMPGVQSASWGRISSSTKLSQLVVPGPGGSERRSGAYPNFVSPDYFITKRTPMLAGRDFNAGDNAASPPVAVLSEALAKTLFGGVNPIGLRFRESDGDVNGQGYSVEVVGVARDIQYRRPDYGPLAILYRPVSQCGSTCSGIGGYEIRTAGTFADAAKQLESAATAVDPRVSLKLGPLSNAMDVVLHRNRAMALTATAFGLFVGLLAMIGVYGVTSYATAERTREIGIRMALGAKPGDVLRMVLGETMWVVCVGAALGAGAGVAAARMFEGIIWGVKPTDPLSFGFGVCLMLLIAGIAAFLPARRAMRVDPMVALRYE